MEINPKPSCRNTGILTEKHVFYFYVTGILMFILMMSLLKGSDKRLERVTLDALVRSKNERIEQLQNQLKENKAVIEQLVANEAALKCRIDSLERERSVVRVIYKERMEKLPTFAAQDVIDYFQKRLSE